MEEVLQIAAIVVAAIVGFTIAGVAGFGGGVVTLPVLIWAFGPKEAIPVVAISQLIGTATRVWLNRKEIDRPAALYFALGSIPLAVLGSFIFVSADTSVLVRIIGAAILVMVVITRLPWSQNAWMKLWGFTPLGATSGFLSAFLGIPGPFAPVFYLAYGLSPAAYVATFSLGMWFVQIPKLAVFGSNGLLTLRVVSLGLGLGLIAIVSSYAGHLLLRRAPKRLFPAIITTMLVVFGVLFLVQG